LELDEFEVPYAVFFTNRRTILALLNNFISAVAMLFLTPILVPHLVKHQHMKEIDAGSALGLCWLTYVVGCPFAAKFYHVTHRRSGIVMSMTLVACGLFLIGPSQVL